MKVTHTHTILFFFGGGEGGGVYFCKRFVLILDWLLFDMPNYIHSVTKRHKRLFFFSENNSNGYPRMGQWKVSRNMVEFAHKEGVKVLGPIASRRSEGVLKERMLCSGRHCLQSVLKSIGTSWSICLEQKVQNIDFSPTELRDKNCINYSNTSLWLTILILSNY